MKPRPSQRCVFLVRMKGGFALQFHLRGYSVVADKEATTFPDRETADRQARDRGLRWGQYEIEPLGPKKEAV